MNPVHREVLHGYPQVYIVGVIYRPASGNQRVPASGQLPSVLSTQTVYHMQQQLTYHHSPDPNNATRFELFPFVPSGGLTKQAVFEC